MSQQETGNYSVASFIMKTAGSTPKKEQTRV